MSEKFEQKAIEAYNYGAQNNINESGVLMVTITLNEYRELVTAKAELLTKIADHIDAEHEAKVSYWRDAYWLAQDKDTMAEHGWYRALDADGLPIRLGDKVYQVEGGWVYTVKSITFYPENTTVSFECKHGFGCDSSHNVRHYHAPTVEDMLHNFICDVEESVRDEREIIAEYAAKLRLANGKEQQ